MQRVFVYGTLKYGNPNHHVLTNPKNGLAEFIGNAITATKYPLVVATSANIPFILNSQGIGQHVCGELYDVDTDMKAALDRLEAVGRFYDIERIEVLTEFNDLEICPAYVLNKYQVELLTLPMLTSYTVVHAMEYVPRTARLGTTLDDLISEVKLC